ncbi:MAG: gamma carbonic anhydrase family protein [Hyphomicrobiales bacterium]|nr:gamma carbonic anhydrase family protein [Hyphomicrobiales bacterium]MBV8426953.1 gamma carbonic anhydrase family protein [Hyphomicrobiales bacterium]
MPVYSLNGVTPKLPPKGRFWIAPGARVIGKVTLHDEVGVWFGAVLRGDNDAIEVGARSNIQDNAMVHVDPGFPVTIGKGCTIGHHAIVHGCSIGNGSLIGMGATVLNGARIGADCLVGANALVTEGKVFDDRSLIVGAPARAIRKLDEAAIKELRKASENYVQRWRRFATRLVEIEG